MVPAGCAGEDEEAAEERTTSAPGTTAAATTTTATTEEPASAPRANIVFQDDFSARDGRWLVESTRTASLAYAKGGYRVRVKDPKASRVTYSASLLAGRVRAVRVEADALLTRAGSDFEVLGVVCIANARGSGYFFGVGPEERYYSLEKVARREFDVEREGRRNKAVRGLGRVNRIRGECIGGGEKPTRVHLVVNGESLAVFKDKDGFDRFEAVGLAVFSVEGGTEVVFDNVVAKRLD